MATSNSTQHDAPDALIPADRANLANDAALELDVLIRLALDGARKQPADWDLMIRGLMVRATSLTSVLMSVLSGDDGRTTQEMRVVIDGGEVAA